MKERGGFGRLLPEEEKRGVDVGKEGGWQVHKMSAFGVEGNRGKMGMIRTPNK